jgi:hypothetical protein
MLVNDGGLFLELCVCILFDMKKRIVEYGPKNGYILAEDYRYTKLNRD